MLGQGKSAVCNTRIGHCQEASRLGAYLFVERGTSDPSVIIRTLALSPLCIVSEILSAIKTDRELPITSPIDRLQKLILNPLLTTAGRLSDSSVIALDALHECRSLDTCKDPLLFLERAVSTLLPRSQFLFTCQLELDIHEMSKRLVGNAKAIRLDHTSNDSHKDARSFLRARFNGFIDIRR